MIPEYYDIAYSAVIVMVKHGIYTLDLQKTPVTRQYTLDLQETTSLTIHIGLTKDTRSLTIHIGFTKDIRDLAIHNKLTKDTRNLAMDCELWYVHCEYFSNDWPFYDKTAL